MPVKCLQSGACCISFEVHGVPGYKDEVKHAQTICIHLVQRYQDEKGWHRARCLLHNTSDYPDECRKFNWIDNPENVCQLGKSVWKHEGVKNPEDDLID